MNTEWQRPEGFEGVGIDTVKAQLALLLMAEEICPSEHGQKDIEYFRQKIARMENNI